MTPIERLQAFCPQDSTRDWLTAPWTCTVDGDRWTVAGDGPTLLATPGVAAEGLHDFGGHPAFSGLLSADVTERVTRRRLRQWLELAPVCACPECEECAGEGWAECYACGHEDTCQVCDGRGIARAPACRAHDADAVTHLRVHGHRVDPVLVRRVLDALPQTGRSVGVHVDTSQSAYGSLVIAVGEWRGVVAGVRSDVRLPDRLDLFGGEG